MGSVHRGKVGVDLLFNLRLDSIPKEMDRYHILQQAGSYRALGAADLVTVKNFTDLRVVFNNLFYISAADIIVQLHGAYSFLNICSYYTGSRVPSL